MTTTVASVVDDYSGPSVAIDASDHLPVSYVGGAALKYTTDASGAWVNETVDAGADPQRHHAIADRCPAERLASTGTSAAQLWRSTPSPRRGAPARRPRGETDHRPQPGGAPGARPLLPARLVEAFRELAGGYLPGWVV